jgi:hypothetical protein
MIKTVLITALISFVVFYVLGLLSQRWLLIRKTPACEHDWQILLEKYPTFTQDRWQCEKCRLVQNFAHDAPPVTTKLDLCDIGHLHVVAIPEWKWPDTIYNVEGKSNGRQT